MNIAHHTGAKRLPVGGVPDTIAYAERVDVRDAVVLTEGRHGVFYTRGRRTINRCRRAMAKSTLKSKIHIYEWGDHFAYLSEGGGFVRWHAYRVGTTQGSVGGEVVTWDVARAALHRAHPDFESGRMTREYTWDGGEEDLRPGFHWTLEAKEHDEGAPSVTWTVDVTDQRPTSQWPTVSLCGKVACWDDVGATLDRALNDALQLLGRWGE